MHEVGARMILLCQLGDVVVTACRQAASTEGEAVVRVWHGFEEGLYILITVQYAWQTEYGERWIIGVYAHIDVIFIADRHDGLKPCLHVLLQLLLGHAVIECQQLTEQLYRLVVALLEVTAHETLRLYHYRVHQVMVFLRSHLLAILFYLSH